MRNKCEQFIYYVDDLFIREQLKPTAFYSRHQRNRTISRLITNGPNSKHH